MSQSVSQRAAAESETHFTKRKKHIKKCRYVVVDNTKEVIETPPPPQFPYPWKDWKCKSK